MTRFALVDPTDAVDRVAENVDPAAQTKAGWRWLPCPPVEKPPFDRASETVAGPTYTVGASLVTESWTRRSLTAQELSDIAEARIDSIDGQNITLRVVFNLHNRLRAVEGQPLHTPAQFRAMIKSIL